MLLSLLRAHWSFTCVLKIIYTTAAVFMQLKSIWFLVSFVTTITTRFTHQFPRNVSCCMNTKSPSAKSVYVAIEKCFFKITWLRVIYKITGKLWAAINHLRNPSNLSLDIKKSKMYYTFMKQWYCLFFYNMSIMKEIVLYIFASKNVCTSRNVESSFSAVNTFSNAYSDSVTYDINALTI